MDGCGQSEALGRSGRVVGRGRGEHGREDQARQGDDQERHRHLPAPTVPRGIVTTVGVVSVVGELVVQCVQQRDQLGVVPGEASLHLRDDAPVVHRGVHTDHLTCLGGAGAALRIFGGPELVDEPQNLHRQRGLGGLELALCVDDLGPRTVCDCALRARERRRLRSTAPYPLFARSSSGRLTRGVPARTGRTPAEVDQTAAEPAGTTRNASGGAEPSWPPQVGRVRVRKTSRKRPGT